ncbi:MAG: hypothetical protein ACI82A_001250 [Candidatus Azotimanducaceae bacterium]|jgi:hypothetical protein
MRKASEINYLSLTLALDQKIAQPFHAEIYVCEKAHEKIIGQVQTLATAIGFDGAFTENILVNQQVHARINGGLGRRCSVIQVRCKLQSAAEVCFCHSKHEPRSHQISFICGQQIVLVFQVINKRSNIGTLFE